MSNKKEYELAVRIAGILDSSLDKSVLHTKRQLRSIANEAVKASAMSQPVSLAESIKNMDPVINGAWKGLTKVAKVGVAAMAAAGAAAVAAGKQAVDVGSEFEKAMSSWKATANATETEYNIARDAAMETGRTTTKTATESANALEYMALAGWNVQDSVKALPGVLHLSESTGLELAETSSLVTDSMAALGIQMDSTGKDFNHYLDVAAKANNSSNQTAEQLMTAYIKTGGVLKSLRIPVEESAAAFGIMANRGLKAEEAGTAMRAVLINLTTGAGKAGKMMDKLGISAFDSQGNFKGLKAVLEEVNQKTKDMTEEERNAAYSALGGKLHIAALTDLMDGLNQTAKDGKSEWDSLQDSLENSAGALEKMAATKMDNLWGDTQILNSALQDTGIRIYDSLRDPLRDAAQELTQLVYKGGDLADTFQTKYPTIKRMIKDAAGDVENIAEPLINLGKSLIFDPKALIPLQTIVGQIVLLKGASTGLHALDTIGKFVAGIGGPKAAIAAAGLTLLASGVVAIHTAMKRVAEDNAAQNMQDHFGTVTLTLQELNDAAEKIMGEDTIQRLSDFTDSFADLSKQNVQLGDLHATVNKIIWKVENGFELSDEDKQTLGDSINQIIADSLSLVEQGDYTAQQSVDALFGADSIIGQGLIAGFNQTYNTLHGQVEDLGKQLGDAYSSAIEDGVLNPDKLDTNTIMQLEQKLQHITDEVANAQSKAKVDMVLNKYQGQDLTSETFQNLQQELGEIQQTELDQAQQAAEYGLSAVELGKSNGTYRSQDEYEAEKKKVQDQYQKRVEDITTRATSWETNRIISNYQPDVDTVTQGLPDIVKQALLNANTEFGVSGNGYKANQAYESTIEDYFKNFGKKNPETRDAINNFLKEMEPQTERLEELYQSYVDAGEKVPEKILEGMSNVNLLKAMGGDENAMLEYIAENLTNDQNLADFYRRLRLKGVMFGNKLVEGIADPTNLDETRNALYNKINNALANPYTVDAEVLINLKPTVTNTPASDQVSSKSLMAQAAEQTIREYRGKTGLTITKRAAGGIIGAPEFDLIGEAGYPEAIIPINQSQRAASLYEQTGALLQSAGNTVNSDNSSRSITFAPNINIAGNASQSEVMSATRASFDEFKRMMAQYERENVRLAL